MGAKHGNMKPMSIRLKLLVFGSLLAIQALWAVHENIAKYLEYLPSSNFGRLGDFTKGEMQIISDYDAILEVQNRYCAEFMKKGYSSETAQEYSRVGVVAEDRYWIWLRDPLILPNGKTTAYNRFFPKSGLNGVAGVSVMGISKEGQVLVNLLFRHATREWEIELPRGGRGGSETGEEAALRELSEETGIRADAAFKIGSIASDSGILANVLDLFVVKDFIPSGEIDREECEAIRDCIFLSKQELKEAFVNGYIELAIDGCTMRVFCRDPFLASALLIAETKGIL